MKRLSLVLVLCLFSLMSYAQTKPKTKKANTTSKTASGGAGAATVSNTTLYQKWMHSYEDEKGDGIEVYRPEGYSFPPSRGRKGLKVQKEGMLVRFDIGPADGTKIVMGKWERTKFPNTMKVIIDGAESSVYFLEVVSISKDMLKVKRKSEI